MYTFATTVEKNYIHHLFASSKPSTKFFKNFCWSKSTQRNKSSIVRVFPILFLQKLQFNARIEKADWEFWRNVLEQEICVPTSQNQDPQCSWELLERILTEATKLYIPTKPTNGNSKPFCNEELSKASNDLRLLILKFKYNSIYRNGQHLAKARDNFRMSESTSTWMSKILAQTGHKHGKHCRSFYNFQNFSKQKPARTSLLKTSKEKCSAKQKDFAEPFKQTFSEAVHLKNHRFDDDHRQK